MGVTYTQISEMSGVLVAVFVFAFFSARAVVGDL